MKYALVALLLVSLCAPMAAYARVNSDCEIWLTIGDVAKWLACRAMVWINRAVEIGDAWMYDDLMHGETPDS